jgi:hypothetical protein
MFWDQVEYSRVSSSLVQAYGRSGDVFYYGNGDSEPSAFKNMERVRMLIELQRRVSRLRSSSEEMQAGDVLDIVEELLRCLI